MIIRQVKEFYKDKKDAPCPPTERLIKAGYQQTGGGYITLAKKRGLIVDYTKAEPTQYWHLIEEYIPTVPEEKVFSKSIVCDELIFWMTEVSKAVPDDKLEELLERIIADGDGATPPNISKEKIIATIMPLPPLAEQRRIAERLDALMQSINVVRDLIASE